MIMMGIEPDLTSAEIGRLDEKYRDETLAQRAERLQSYEKAFAVFDDVYAKVTGHCSQDAQVAHAALRTEREKKEHAEHAREIDDAESQINTDVGS